ncbi:MAG: DUF92 domain-containing protein, partial [Candidatus Tumulicola sp.]
MTNAILGAALAAAVALVAYRVRALSAGGAWAAFAVGALVFGTSGWRGALVLFAFFIPSTLLSRFGRSHKAAFEGKQGPRDAWQVLANGGIAAICALLALRLPPFAAAFS